MRVFMVGEAGRHGEELSVSLPGDFEIVTLPDRAAALSDFDDQIGREDVVISMRLSRQHSRMPDFRLLHLPGAGTDGIDFETLSPDCWVCNVYEHEIPLAEFALLAMLRWTVRLEEMQSRFGPDIWSASYRSRVPHPELAGQTVGIIGYGRIGRAVAKRAKAFGMRVHALTRHRGAGDSVDLFYSTQELPLFLGEADFVVVACALTPETRGLLDAEAFRAMKRSAVLINVARGEIVEEQALYEALEEGVIGGAYLDVWYKYPKGPEDNVLPSRFAFHKLPNVVCTPHSAAWSTKLMQRRYRFIGENLGRLQRGEPLLNVVRAAAVPNSQTKGN